MGAEGGKVCLCWRDCVALRCDWCGAAQHSTAQRHMPPCLCGAEPLYEGPLLTCRGPALSVPRTVVAILCRETPGRRSRQDSLSGGGGRSCQRVHSHCHTASDLTDK
ncbi:hypothetical protein E2C01_036642 [Portunus trituberculatus]|uniref:Uncharacterized protein n=1 Tax=Portunus trituberculatus TaxID=210409 RepID=A0A5B7FBR3_PORTR|nr:hypothetical protein [Portunus trituberculatus]